jgi:uncharacterized protein YnzC (UPF0291/DUF896 family)
MPQNINPSMEELRNIDMKDKIKLSNIFTNLKKIATIIVKSVEIILNVLDLGTSSMLDVLNNWKESMLVAKNSKELDQICENYLKEFKKMFKNTMDDLVDDIKNLRKKQNKRILSLIKSYKELNCRRNLFYQFRCEEDNQLSIDEYYSEYNNVINVVDSVVYKVDSYKENFFITLQTIQKPLKNDKVLIQKYISSIQELMESYRSSFKQDLEQIENLYNNLSNKIIKPEGKSTEERTEEQSEQVEGRHPGKTNKDKDLFRIEVIRKPQETFGVEGLQTTKTTSRELFPIEGEQKVQSSEYSRKSRRKSRRRSHSKKTRKNSVRNKDVLFY